MIVVIQSDDFDQSQGLIVVDPSQIQHVVGADGVRSTTVTTADGTTMILGNSSTGNDDDDEGKHQHNYLAKLKIIMSSCFELHLQIQFSILKVF